MTETQSEDTKMKKNFLLLPGIAAALSLAGCRSGNTNAETEALREQIAQLQQQISDLEQQAASENSSDTPDAPANDSSPVSGAAESGGTGDSAPASDPAAEAAADSSTADQAAPAANPESESAASTTHTMEELTNMVTDYEEKAAAAALSSSAHDDIEQFMNLKQEEKQIDRDLDLHEDELEALYRNGSLSRDEYKKLEQELERLEDRLDAAEDTLEYVYDIDD